MTGEALQTPKVVLLRLELCSRDSNAMDGWTWSSLHMKGM